MPDVVLVEATPEHLSQVERWAGRNAAIKTLLKLPATSPKALSDAHNWVALSGEEVIAIVTIWLNKEHVGYINCVVKPAAKRQGLGTQIMKYALEQPFVTDLVHLHAIIDPANAPALKVLDNLGFSRFGYDANGYMELARHKH